MEAALAALAESLPSHIVLDLNLAGESGLRLLPLLRASLGAETPLPRAIAAKLAGPMAKGGGRMEFLRGVWDGVQVTLDPLQDSGALSPLARANALVVREAGAEAKAAGTDVPVYLLENGGFA